MKLIIDGVDYSKFFDDSVMIYTEEFVNRLYLNIGVLPSVKYIPGMNASRVTVEYQYLGGRISLEDRVAELVSLESRFDENINTKRYYFYICFDATPKTGEPMVVWM